jgi:hypothetical protein
LVSSNESLKPVALFHSEGARAEILRSVVVFLHATVEDFLRSRLPKPNKSLSFYSSADLDKALKRSGIDATPLKPLYPPLTALAKRKNRIVHDADLSNRTATVVEAWGVIDDWQLIMWLLAVPAFYQLRASLGIADVVERTRLGNLQEAMQRHVDFGKQLLALPHVEPALRIEAVQKLADTLKRMSAAMKLDVSDFTVNEAGEIVAAKSAPPAHTPAGAIPNRDQPLDC